MSQPRRIPRHFFLSHDQNGVAVPNEESQNRLLTVADTTEQMAFNISLLNSDRSPREINLSPLPTKRSATASAVVSLEGDSKTISPLNYHDCSATQVGHQLAVIGDEFNSTYTRKLEDMLFHLAQGMAVNVLKILHMHFWKSIIKSFRSLLNNGWPKRVVAYGSWISRLPLKSMCQRLMPAALFVILFWWTVSYGLQN